MNDAFDADGAGGVVRVVASMSEGSTGVPKPSGLDVCVRNRAGRFVVPCQPVEALLHAIAALEEAVYRDGQVGTREDSDAVRAAQRVVLNLLGLEPGPAPMDAGPDGAECQDAARRAR